MSDPTEISERLFDEFDAPGVDAWKQEAERLLRGASFEERLLTRTLEGITLQPMYRRDDVEALAFIDSYPGFAPHVRGGACRPAGGDGWHIAQEPRSGTAAIFNRELLHGLERGLTAVNLPIDAAGRQGLAPDQATPDAIGRDGVSIVRAADLAAALAGVDLSALPIYLDTGACGMPYLGLLTAVVQEAGHGPASLSGAITADPLGELVTRGALRQPLAAAYDSLAEMTLWAAKYSPGLATIGASGGPYLEGGGHAIQELAFAVSTAIESLRELEARGVDVEIAAPRVQLAFGLGCSFFMEIAKLRAARLVWNRVLEACELSPARRSVRIHVRTARYTQTLHDPHVNLLRATTEALAGVIGGASSLHVAAFDEIGGGGGDGDAADAGAAEHLGARLARNIQVIIKEEAHLDRIIDPAGGSWYVERLTDTVARGAWALVQQVEAMGGMAAALAAGFPQREVATTARERGQAFATRRSVMVGTNRYPDTGDGSMPTRGAGRATALGPPHAFAQEPPTPPAGEAVVAALERLASVRDDDAAIVAAATIGASAAGASIGQIVEARSGKHDAAAPSIVPIARQRGAEPFERLRAAVEHHRATVGGARVYIATLGPPGRYMARLDFAGSFFAVGGFEVVRNDEHENGAAVVAAALAETAEVTVLCGLDETYVEDAAPAARAIRQGDPERVIVLAGRPRDEALLAELAEAGVDVFIHAHSNVLEVLSGIAARLGIDSIAGAAPTPDGAERGAGS